MRIKSFVLRLATVLFLASSVREQIALAQGGTWSTRAPMPTARYSTGVGVVNGIIYVMGGTTSVTSLGTNIGALEAYDPTSNTWSTKAPMPTPRHSFGVSVVNGILYTVGGFAFSCLCSVPTVEAYDPSSDTWVTKAPMLAARNGLATGVVNGIIYAAGGNSASSLYLPTVEAYDPVSDTWSAKASMPTARYEPAAGVVDDILYVVGGSEYGNLSTLEAYDATTDTWSTKSPMPTPRYYLGSGILNELLYAVGGFNDSTTLSSVEAYDPTSQSWTAVTPMPTPRIPSVAVVNGTLYAIGGYDYVHGIPLSTVEAFSPTTPGAAQLNGGNTLTGNQTITGNVSAASFVGNGSGLTGVNAQTAATASALNCTGCVGNSQLSINYAAGDAQGGNALNALMFGGFLPGAFAPAGGSPNYVAKSGDTMTGTLNLPSNGLVAGGNQFVLTSGNVGIGTASPSAPLHVLKGASSLPNIGDNSNMVALFENNTTGNSTNVWLNAKPSSAGGLTENYYFAVNGAGTGGLRYNVAGSYLALLTDTSPSGVNNEPFVLKGRNVGIGTLSPAAQLDVNGTANFSGLVTFAPGQTFPGAGNGTITGVTAGSGLSGGGSSSSVTLSLNTNFTDARYLSFAGGTLTGGLTAPSFMGNGAGLTALNPANLSTGTAAINISGNAATSGIAANSAALGGVAAGNYARLDASNNFNGTQSVSGDVSAAGTVSATNATFTGPLVPGFPGGVSTAGVMVNRKGGATSTQGFPSYPLALWASSFSSTTTNPVWNHIFQFVAEPTGNNTPNPSATMNLQFVSTNFPPTPNGYTFQETGFSVGTNGQTTTGALTINNGGTPITKHVSTTFNVLFQPLKPSACIVMTFTLTGARDGDTLALGLPNALMTVGGIPAFFAWVSLPDQISVRACNMDPNIKQTTASSGVIRVDLWKH